ncbi:MAG TPA: hydroxysqualene dehydroxylase HpnE [Thiobacillaceae bacterium]|nr:hydroxysqualene dehydroxylase HpnE [Thiobacillaceae bacterium]
MKRIAVVGGGWAGLAAAVRLAEAGRPVTLFEAARQLGGRARRVDWQGLAIDNGQHLMIGAYRETLALMRTLGTDSLLARRPLELSVPDFRLSLPQLPAPLNLIIGQLMAEGLSLKDKLAAAGFMQALKRNGFLLPADGPADELLARHRQPPELVAKLWEPICVAALNTPLRLASAQVFCNVLRDSLARSRADSDLLYQRAHLGRLVPEAARGWLEARGCRVRLSSRVGGIERIGKNYRMSFGEGGEEDFDAVVLAIHPVRLPDLLGQLPQLAAVREQVSAFGWQPILTSWMRFAAPLSFPLPMLGLAPGQGPWVFDRGDVAPGLAAVVISAEGPHLHRPPETLREEFLDLMGRALGPLPELQAWKTIVEKRATFACTPGLSRPGNRTPLPGLVLAGDYTGGDFPTEDYPATLEGAVRSGVKSARLLLESS